MLFNLAYKRNNKKLCEVRERLKQEFDKDYNDLSEKTKIEFEEKYKILSKIIIEK